MMDDRTRRHDGILWRPQSEDKHYNFPAFAGSLVEIIGALGTLVIDVRDITTSWTRAVDLRGPWKGD